MCMDQSLQVEEDIEEDITVIILWTSCKINDATAVVVGGGGGSEIMFRYQRGNVFACFVVELFLV